MDAMRLTVAIAVGFRGRREQLEEWFASGGDEVRATSSWAGLQELLGGGHPDLVVIDHALLEHAPLARLAPHLGDPRLGVIVVSHGDDFEERALLQAAGCLAVIDGRLSDPALVEVLARATETWKRELDAQLSAEGLVEHADLTEFASESPAMRATLRLADRVAASHGALLLQGETGSGKEWLARAIHRKGPRSGGPFVAVNCGAFPEQLLESELFGHERGAFTGAQRTHRGRFEMAHGGTLFLDEIGDMPAHLQVSLLRVVEEQAVLRVGGEQPIAVDVRIMSATHRDLSAAITKGSFRSDLYYRLAVLRLDVPALRGRREDIPSLAQGNLERLRERHSRRARGFTPAALRALVDYPWPGNVRELRNVIERAALLCDGLLIDEPHLGLGTAGEPTLDQAPESARPGPPHGAWARQALASGLSLTAACDGLLADAERAYLSAVLEDCGGRVGEAARRAGLSERGLHGKMKELGLRKERFRSGPGAPLA